MSLLQSILNWLHAETLTKLLEQIAVLEQRIADLEKIVEFIAELNKQANS
jgi:hypothetical protein